MAKTVVVLQSNYIPWKGYFDLIHDCDLFIFHDDLQFTKNDWRNRNKIKTPRGLEWLTIPVGTSEKRNICEVQLPEPSWQKKHWNKLLQNYQSCRFFNKYGDFFRSLFLERTWNNLSDLNQYLVISISRDFLGIEVEFADSRSFDLQGQKQDRLLELLGKAGATRYVSGPAAKDYIEPLRFKEANIQLVWKDYGGYPQYSQQFGTFEHGVSIIDLLFNMGPETPQKIWGWRDPSSA